MVLLVRKDAILRHVDARVVLIIQSEPVLSLIAMNSMT